VPVLRVADGRDGLLAVEPQASGEIPVKPVRAHRLPDLSHHLGSPLPFQRPRLQADTLAKALGRPRQQRGPFSLTLHERQLGEHGQAQGHVAGVVGRQAQLQPSSSSARASSGRPRTRAGRPSCTWDHALSPA
jgi:hypothetical protein